MADHSNNNPITGLFGMLVGSVTSIYGAVFLIGAVVGGMTGNVPIRGSLLNPWETGQYVGGLLNTGTNSGVQTFGDEKYFQNVQKIGGVKPDQRLMAPSRTPSTILPTSTNNNNSQTLDVSATSNSTVAPYQDLNGDGVIDPKEIEVQNKAKKQ